MSSLTTDNLIAGPGKLVRHAREVLQKISSQIPITLRSTHSLTECRTDSTHTSSLEIHSDHEIYSQHVSVDVVSTFPEVLGHQTSYFYEQAPHVVQLANASFSASAALIDPSIPCVAHSPPVKAAYLVWHARQEILEWQHTPVKLGPGVGHIFFLASHSPVPFLTENTLRCHVVLPTVIIQPISVLLRAMLRAGAREAFGPTPLTRSIHQNQTEGKECPILFQLFQWLATQLARFIEPALCAQAALSLFRQVFVNPGPFLKPVEKTEANDPDCWQKEVKTALQKLESARAGVQISHLPAQDRGGEYTALVERAEAERQKRGTQYKDDGSDHLGAAGRQANARKSSVELAAEERDFKRRRVKYRSSANKRTPTQILHDLIQDQMQTLIEEAPKISTRS